MHVTVTGGTGQVGRFVVTALLRAGHRVTLLGRRPPPFPGAFVPAPGFQPWALGEAGLPEADALVHCAFDHLPGRYRGGEGADPAGFWRRNVEGSLDLFAAAAATGYARGVFLSSRAVYGGKPGAPLRETDTPAPDTLYGEAKLAVERALPPLGANGFFVAAIRATGVYGLCPGSEHHKWRRLFAEHLQGRPAASRVATELHGTDLAAAVVLLLTVPGFPPGAAFNASDLVLDRRDLLARLAALTGAQTPLPARADAARLSVMRTDRLQALGWSPGGDPQLAADLPAMAELAQRDAAR